MSVVDRTTLPTPGPSRLFRFPDIHRAVLANGLEICAVSHRNIPVVSAVLLVRSGTAADPPDRPGLAAFTGDLLDEGSGGRSALDISDALGRLGADLDVDVNADATVLSLTSITKFLRPAVALLAEMATAPNFDRRDIERVRKLRLERLQQLVDHAPAVAERVLARLLYRDHPYGHLGLGTEQALDATTADEIRAFHASAFVPSRATLVVVGDRTPDQLVAAAEAAFAAWRPAPGLQPLAPDAGRRMPPAAPEARLALVDRPSAAQSEIRIGQVCASRDTRDYHALILLNLILGGQFVSRVNLNLRQEKGYTYGARTGFDLRRGLGPFVLQTSVQTEVTAAAIREALRELAEIRGARPATTEELEAARAAATRGYPRGFETAQQVARGVAQLALHELPDSYFEEFVPRVDAVTLADVTRVAGQYLEPARMVTLAVGDRARIAESLETLGLGEAHLVVP